MIHMSYKIWYTIKYKMFYIIRILRWRAIQPSIEMAENDIFDEIHVWWIYMISIIIKSWSFIYIKTNRLPITFYGIYFPFNGHFQILAMAGTSHKDMKWAPINMDFASLKEQLVKVFYIIFIFTQKHFNMKAKYNIIYTYRIMGFRSFWSYNWIWIWLCINKKHV